MKKSVNKIIEEDIKKNASSDDKEIDALSTREQILEKNIKEERLMWVLAIIVLLDFFYFKDVQNWSGPFVIGIIELVFILALGQRLGINFISTLIDKVLEAWNTNNLKRDN